MSAHTSQPTEETLPIPVIPPELPCVIAQGELMTTPVLIEAAAIHDLLYQASQRRLERRRSNWRDVAAFPGAILLYAAVLVVWEQLPDVVKTVFAVATAVGVLFMVVQAGREWTRRDVSTMAQLIEAAATERALIQKLLPFSRSSLLHVAATARAAEARVDTRIVLFLGANRAGGLMGGLLVLIGAFSAGKYLQDTQTTVPILNLPITAVGVITTVLLAYGLVATLLFTGHSVNALPHYAELLERVANLKKNLKDDKGS
ncbi:hypothetical protein [Deinococcus xianganensis]|uniref:Uncharacterized protein n=1 Tax=Deinococcus xianganensis TaxID=1507289 RepID=A0A6I4YLT6_9DEIO|nr:hypothetical protein [Deinococcus xianganensis]MXV20007.1 hypothetical protein [Deinococcus xianganensis]